MSCKFEIGQEPVQYEQRVQPRERADTDNDSASVTTTRTATTAIREKQNPWWPNGRPPKGRVAWVDDDSLIVVGAGRDSRWELFVLGVDQKGQSGIERRGWKRYMEDEGVDG